MSNFISETMRNINYLLEKHGRNMMKMGDGSGLAEKKAGSAAECDGRKGKRVALDMERVMELRLKGNSLAAIGEILGVNPETVRYALTKRGIVGMKMEAKDMVLAKKIFEDREKVFDLGGGIQRKLTGKEVAKKYGMSLHTMNQHYYAAGGKARERGEKGQPLKKWE